MDILLDTHVLLWALADTSKLTQRAKSLLLDEHNKLFFSSVSLLEIQLKHDAAPEKMSFTSHQIYQECASSDLIMLALKNEHVFNLEQISLYDNKDPFDRLLVSVAFTEHMYFLTHDQKILRSGFVHVLEI